MPVPAQRQQAAKASNQGNSKAGFASKKGSIKVKEQQKGNMQLTEEQRSELQNYLEQALAGTTAGQQSAENSLIMQGSTG